MTITEFENSPAVYAIPIDGSAIVRTRTQTTTQSWERVLAVEDLLSGSNRSIFAFALDPWRPKMAAYVAVRHAGPQGDRDGMSIVYIDNLNGLPGTQVVTTLFTHSADGHIEDIQLVPSISIRGGVYGIAIWGQTFGNGIEYFERNSYQQSWSVTQFSPGSELSAGLDVGKHVAGPSSGRIAMGGSRYLRESTDLGGQWT